jgi:crotonobetainyl-CoA:carnitine CoA-transferase CaiB-like acyl-CoA transferase
VADVVASEQTKALGMLQSLTHPRIPDLELPALPLSFDGERATHRLPPPLVGEHTAEVLGEVGYTEEEIEELAAAGVARLG